MKRDPHTVLVEYYGKINMVKKKIEETLDPSLHLEPGNLIIFNEDNGDISKRKEISHFEVTKNDDLIVHYLPEYTPVRNTSMFMYGLSTSYKVVKK